MLKKIFGDRAQSSFYALLFMTVGLVLFGWYNVYSQYVSLREATTKSIQAAELEIVRATARAATVYWDDQLTILGLDPDTITPEQVQEIELQFLAKYVKPISLLVPEGDAWVIGSDDRMVFDRSADFPYFGVPINEFLPRRAKVPGGASDYDQMLDDVMSRREGIGWYVWDQNKGSEYAGLFSWEKGIEIGAWTPAVVDEKNNVQWMIGLTTPLAAIMQESGARDSVNRSFLFMAVVTIVIGLVFSGFLAGQRRVRALQHEVAQLKIVIDEAKKRREVEQILGSDYFQSLQKRAAEIRAKSTKERSA
ncbi:MAG: hypothetical protein HY865_14630 [Chloroflexi bacterium]|nr:hypothetical protein [Chloroflexota bacterium]